MPNDADTTDELWTAELALRRAQFSSDVAELDRLIDPALIFTGPDGKLYSKEDDLTSHRSGAMRLTRLDATEEHVQRFGDVAVVIVRMEMAGSFQGAEFAGAYRYTRVWRRTESGWRIVSGHVSAIAG